MSYDEWYQRTVASYWRHRSGQRWGQYYYNCLPDRIARQLVATILDPFHREQVPVETEEFVRSIWEFPVDFSSPLW